MIVSTENSSVLRSFALTLTCEITNVASLKTVTWSGGDIASGGITASQPDSYTVNQGEVSSGIQVATLVVSAVKMTSFGSDTSFTCSVSSISGEIRISIVTPGCYSKLFLFSKHIIVMHEGIRYYFLIRL